MALDHFLVKFLLSSLTFVLFYDMIIYRTLTSE
jgi:hypothetical protein